MSYFGAKQIRWGEFAGICSDVDPTELPANIAYDAQNIEFDGRAASLRGGCAYYNATAPTGARVWGMGAYYPASGSRSLVMAGGGNVYVDKNQDGDFSDSGETILSGLTDGIPVDLAQWKNDLLIGNNAEGLYTWSGSSTAVPATPKAASAYTPQLSLYRVTLEDFESSTWVGTVGSLTASVQAQSATDPAPFEGVKSLRLTATAKAAEGQWAYLNYGAGPQNLAAYDYLELYVWCKTPGPSFRIGVFATGADPTTDSPDWSLFPAFQVEKADARQWFKVRVPLGVLDKDALTAVAGLAIQYLNDGGRGYTHPVRLWFDNLLLGVSFDKGEYTYYYTGNDDNGISFGYGETFPSPAASIVVGDECIAGITVKLRHFTAGQWLYVYRFQKGGQFPQPRRVKVHDTGSDVGSYYTFTDSLDAGALAIQAAQGNAPALDLQRAGAPVAKTYAVVNNRVLAGGAGGAYRVWVSYFGLSRSWSAVETPSDPLSAGWFDLPEKDPIVRIIDYHGVALIFTNRSVWTLTGSGFADYAVVKRGPWGLLNREAVAVVDGEVYFLSRDGVRVLRPHATVGGEFECYLISEPIASRIAGMSNNEIGAAAMGQDERGRVHLSVGTGAYIFDPRQPKALSGGTSLTRPGWSYHTEIGGPCYTQLRRGGSGLGWLDAGQMLTAAEGVLKLQWVFHGPTNLPLWEDRGEALEWFWLSPAVLADAGSRLVAQWVTGLFLMGTEDQTIDATIYNETEGTQAGPTLTIGSLALGARPSYFRPPPARFGPASYGAALHLKLSGTQSVPLSIRQVMLGVLQR